MKSAERQVDPLSDNETISPLVTIRQTTTLRNDSFGDFNEMDNINTSHILNPTPCLNRLRQTLRHNLLLVLTATGVILGFIVGFSIRTTRPSQTILMAIGVPGDIFLRLLKMTIVPLVVTCTIAGTATLDAKSNRKIGLICVSYLVCINLLGSLLGIALGLTIQPGDGIKKSQEIDKEVVSLKTEDVILDMIRNVFTDNVVRATFQKVQTRYEAVEVKVKVNMTHQGPNQTTDMSPHLGYADSSNTLGLIFACVIIGVAAGNQGENGRPFVDFFESLALIILDVITWFLWTSPVGVASLIASSVGGVDDIRSVFLQLGLLVIAVTSGVATQQLIVLPLIHVLLTRTNPYVILMQMSNAWLLAFSCAMSPIAMPELFKICERNKIDRHISGFAIPLSRTLNAHGSALFICIASLFLAQTSNVPLNVGQVATLVVLTTVSALALPSVPSASIVTLVMVMATLGLPADNFGLLIAVEWLLDRVRTTSNVVGDLMSVFLINHFTKNDSAMVHSGRDHLSEESSTNSLPSNRSNDAKRKQELVQSVIK